MEQAQKQGLPVPDRIKYAPRLLPGLEFYFQAFLDLSTCRKIGMAEGPIPWDAVDAYAGRHGLEGDEYERFFSLIRAMDAGYLKHRDSKIKKRK